MKSMVLPAKPALELGSAQPVKFSNPIAVSAQGNTYRAPKGFQAKDLSKPGDPPACLGAFYPK